jgi:peroxiredoxin (alkyl hydroperoxide reductase subunit C)
MSVINTQIKPFKTQAFKNGKFIEVTEKDVLGKWAVFFFYPADFTHQPQRKQQCP